MPLNLPPSRRRTLLHAGGGAAAGATLGGLTADPEHRLRGAVQGGAIGGLAAGGASALANRSAGQRITGLKGEVAARAEQHAAEQAAHAATQGEFRGLQQQYDQLNANHDQAQAALRGAAAANSELGGRLYTAETRIGRLLGQPKFHCVNAFEYGCKLAEEEDSQRDTLLGAGAAAAGAYGLSSAKPRVTGRTTHQKSELANQMMGALQEASDKGPLKKVSFTRAELLLISGMIGATGGALSDPKHRARNAMIGGIAGAGTGVLGLGLTPDRAWHIRGAPAAMAIAGALAPAALLHVASKREQEAS